MRISEERYTRDRRALDVALRLIDFEARTGTIRTLTGLADGQIRSLTRDSTRDGANGNCRRHRGKAPTHAKHILGKARSRNEAATLLGLCQLMGVTPEDARVPQPGTNRVLRAEWLCDVYWTFSTLLPTATLSFEHFLLLLTEVEKSVEMTSTHCRSCNAVQIVDLLSLRATRCPHCAEHAPYRRFDDERQYANVAEESAAYN